MSYTLQERLKELSKDFMMDWIDVSSVKMYIFTFIDSKNKCEICTDAISAMNNMLALDQRFKDNRILWIIEADMCSNLLCRDAGITVSPTTIITDADFRLLNMRIGIPLPDDINIPSKQLFGNAHA